MRLPRPTWFEIDLDAAAENLRTVRRLVGPDRKIFAVLKADAYGFGALPMARVFAAHGADALAVADLAEGVRLRRHDLALPILLYPSALPEMASEVLAHGLLPTLTDLEGARAYSDAARGPCPVFVKVDVGLERLGVAAEQTVKVVRAMLELPRLRLAGLCAHPHAPPEVDAAYVEWQLARFTGVIQELTGQGVEIPIRMVASSRLVLRFPQTHLNAVDPGWILYGLTLATEALPPIPLRPAFRALKTRLIAEKEIAPRARFADRAPFPVAAPMRLGVIPIGTADGLGTLHAGRVLVRGRAAPLSGSPALEHTRVDLTAVPDARVGDEVVLIGRQGTEAITPDEVAARHGLEPHRLALAVGPRVARVFLAGGAVAETRPRPE
ncbi:MAG: alanine racemase [Candidatus Rokuibacteriota bacterium]